MARKVEIVIVPAWDGNRDAGKHFQIREMAAAVAEKWAWRLFIALKGSGSEIPESAQRLGMVGVAFAGFNTILRAQINPDELEPLLDQMMTCVRLIRDPGARDKTTNEPIASEIVSDDDIEEVQTIGWLRAEVLRVHTGFMLVAAIQKWLEDSKKTETSSGA